jgi:hypothetical protein
MVGVQAILHCGCAESQVFPQFIRVVMRSSLTGLLRGFPWTKDGGIFPTRCPCWVRLRDAYPGADNIAVLVNPR